MEGYQRSMNILELTITIHYQIPIFDLEEEPILEQ